MKFGLRGIRRLLRALDHPERRFISVHIAGTNGKGSVASMIAAVLTAAGYRTGLYTSPHLLDYRERIRINGVPISKQRLVSLVSEMQPLIARYRSTFFEATTAIAFRYFAEEKVDVAVIETGLGGRLDATNVLRPLLSVITTIGHDHTHILGTTLRAIASEKAGIIKTRVPCVTGVESGVALDVIRETCRERSSRVRTTREVVLSPKKLTLLGSTLDARLPDRMLSDLHVALPGTFQLKNIAVSLLALDELSKGGRVSIPYKAVFEGLENVQKLTAIRGRLSVVRTRPKIICDVAHNPDAARSLREALEELGVEKVRLVFGAMKDKDFRSMLRALASLAVTVALVRAATSRSAQSHELLDAARKVGLRATTFDTVREGLLHVLRGRDTNPVLVTGSHFVVAEALAYLQRKKYLTINQ